MPGRMRRRAERFGLAAMSGLGIAVLVADVLGWLDRLAPGSTIPKITLLILSTVTLFLLLEVERFQTLDNIEARLAGLDIEAISRQLRLNHYEGLVKVHPHFAEEHFIRYVGTARKVTILNTWIPNLAALEDALLDALNRRAKMQILLLLPNSSVAGLRAKALRARAVKKPDDDVKAGVYDCLDILASIHKRVRRGRESCLQVRVFNSLPSISVYRADDRYLVSMFLHGQLAIHSPQFEIDGADTPLGRQVQREVDTLWEIGYDVDLTDWERQIDLIRP